MKFVKTLKGIGIFAGGFILGGMMFVNTSDDSTITTEKPVEQKATKAETEAAATPTEEKKIEAPKQKEPVQVYTDDKVTIYFKENTTNGVKFLVENKTSKTLTIQADSVAVNGFSANQITMSDNISPMSKGYAEASTDELIDAGEPSTVSGGLRVIDLDTFDSYNVDFTNIPVQ